MVVKINWPAAAPPGGRGFPDRAAPNGSPEAMVLPILEHSSLALGIGPLADQGMYSFAAERLSFAKEGRRS